MLLEQFIHWFPFYAYNLFVYSIRTGFIIEYIILIIISYFTADSTFTVPDISLDPVV